MRETNTQFAKNRGLWTRWNSCHFSSSIKVQKRHGTCGETQNESSHYRCTEEN